MTQREDDEPSTQELVAAEVRAELARQRWSGRRAARALGWSQPYLSRRLNGDTPFDVADLAALARLLDTEAAAFFPQIRGELVTVAAMPRRVRTARLKAWRNLACLPHGPTRDRRTARRPDYAARGLTGSGPVDCPTPANVRRPGLGLAARACDNCIERDCDWPHDYCPCACHDRDRGATYAVGLCRSGLGLAA